MAESTSLSSEGLEHLPGASTAEKRSLARWYAAARTALAHNRPLTTATEATAGRPVTGELSASALTALRAVCNL